MKKTAITALAVYMAITATACGNIGKPDPTMITKKSDYEKYTTDAETVTTYEEEKEDESSASEGQDDSSIPDLEIKPPVYSPSEDAEAFAEAAMDKMTLEEKVGQLFFVRPDALETGFENKVVSDDTIGGVTYVDKLMTDSLAKYHVGGIVLYEKNIIDGEQLKKLTSELQENSETPLFIGVNEIGGDYAPIANNVNFDVQLFGNMNTISSIDNAETLGNVIGEYLVSYGVNVDLAPIADVSYNANNVSDCNFGSAPAIVANMVEAEIKGLHSGGVMTAVNSFPGYADGHAEGNSLYRNSNSWEYILDNDALPYLGVLDDTDMLMVGHIELPNVVSDGLPASMSKELIEGRIRDELGYDGVIITGSMEANSVRKNFFQNECAVNAIKAGADIVLTPYDLAEEYDSVIKAVEKGEISEERINESVKRILMLKAEYGLFG